MKFADKLNPEQRKHFAGLTHKVMQLPVEERRKVLDVIDQRKHHRKEMGIPRPVKA
jgi:hypothetical protein